MNHLHRSTFPGSAGWALPAVAALVALGLLWHFDPTRVWDNPRWDDRALVVLGAAEQDARPEPLGGREPASKQA